MSFWRRADWNRADQYDIHTTDRWSFRHATRMPVCLRRPRNRPNTLAVALAVKRMAHKLAHMNDNACPRLRLKRKQRIRANRAAVARKAVPAN